MRPLYKEPNHQLQILYGDEQFYDFDPVIKLSDYNELLRLRNMDTIECKRQILMRSGIKLPQPFASWSNSL